MSQARATDPLTSHLATGKSNDFWDKVLEDLKANGPSDVWEISVRMGEKETAVSPVMRPMAREGMIHEEGWHRSKETGERRILWAAGSAEGWKPGSSMPKRQTGPRRPSFDCFFPEDIEKLNLSVGQDLEKFTTALNKAIMERLQF